VQICIDDCDANVNAILAATGRTALHHAAVVGNGDIVRLLLAARADPDAVHDRNGDTPLTLAAAAGHVGVVTTLGRAGADSNLPRRHDGATPLEIALMYDSTACLVPLLELGADPYATSRWPSGRTVYELAVSRADIHTVAMLYDAMSAPPQHGAHVRITDESPAVCDDCHAFGLYDAGLSAGPRAIPRIYVPSDDLKTRTPPPTWKGTAVPPDAECIVCRIRRPIPDAAERAMWCSRAHNAFAPCGHGALLCGMCCAVLATCPYCRADAFNPDES
jgi:FOG: Ankyrin repeat